MSLLPSVHNTIRRALLAVLLWAAAAVFAAEGDAQVYLPVQDFLGEVFTEVPATTQMLWLDAPAREEARRISGEDPGFRTRYWQQQQTTAWVLEVIGRDHPITLGIAVDDSGIRALRVLVYRESRGWEVRHDFFTRQFDGARLDGRRLDRRIDGITGATLSVNALQRAARLALWLHHHATAD